MTVEQIVTISSLLVGLLGFIFGVYAHFSTRKVAKLQYEVVQLTDFNLPASFLRPLETIPVMLTVYSVGNKRAENINIQIQLASPVVEWHVESDEPYEEIVHETHAQLLMRSLNPEEVIRLSLQCRKDMQLKTYVREIKVTHSEGVGVDVKALAAQRERLVEMMLEIVMKASPLSRLRL